MEKICNEIVEVLRIPARVDGGDYTWPGGTQYLKPWLVGKLSRDINAGEMILDLFLKHSRKASPTE